MDAFDEGYKQYKAKEKQGAIDELDFRHLDGLTEKQRHFVMEYLKDNNATAAVARMGYVGNNAQKYGWALANKPKIKKAIDKARAKLLKKMNYSVERAVEDINKQLYGAMLSGNWIAVGNIQKHKDCVLGIYDPNKKEIDINLKSGFNLTLGGGIALPLYAKDVTPLIEAIEGEIVEGADDSEDEGEGG